MVTAIQQIPAPTFAERTRADHVTNAFISLGLSPVFQDHLHNVYARLPGLSDGAPIVVTAHMDTVFPSDTDLTLRREGARLHGPGVGDNAAGVAGLLAVAEVMVRFGLTPDVTVWFVANVGEEGLGDLVGMRAVAERFDAGAAFIVVEGGLFGQVLHQAIAVKRYRLTVKAPGGHSWKNFGQPSAIHELSRLVTAITALDVPRRPWTTFNVGVIEGGTSVNTIAATANCLLDLRSEQNRALERLRRQVAELVATADGQPNLAVTMDPIGNRPAGAIPRAAPLVRLAAAALKQMGCDQVNFTSGSTDANIPLSQKRPAVCIGLAEAGHVHRLDEFLDTGRLPAGLGQLLLLVLGAAARGGATGAGLTEVSADRAHDDGSPE